MGSRFREQEGPKGKGSPSTLQIPIRWYFSCDWLGLLPPPPPLHRISGWKGLRVATIVPNVAHLLPLISII